MTEMTLTSADGTKLAVRCTGHGSPIVLVHGAVGVDAFALIEGLLAEWHSVWVYSRRGRGGSGDGPDYTYQRELEDVLTVLATAGDGAHLFGHSCGAFSALLAAAEASSLRSLVLYELPLIDRLDASVSDHLVDEMDTALDAGDPDWALELFLPLAGIVDPEVQALQALEPVWARLRAGVRLVPRELRSALRDGPDWRVGFDPPDVPTLYLHGEQTDAPMFPSPREVPDLLPNAQLHRLPRQRHLASPSIPRPLPTRSWSSPRLTTPEQRIRRPRPHNHLADATARRPATWTWAYGRGVSRVAPTRGALPALRLARATDAGAQRVGASVQALRRQVSVAEARVRGVFRESPPVHQAARAAG
jgi:pimeloyl-ACP methyl ester carboxylesterase